MVERSLSMREVQGSIPCISIFLKPWGPRGGRGVLAPRRLNRARPETEQLKCLALIGVVPPMVLKRVDDEGFEPSTFRMQNGRSTTELNAHRQCRSPTRGRRTGKQ